MNNHIDSDEIRNWAVADLGATDHVFYTREATTANNQTTNPWPALHGCMAGSGDGSGDEVRFGTVSLDLFGGLPCRALPPGEGDLKARVSLVCDPPLVTIH